MNILSTIVLLFVAFSLGSVGSILFLCARYAKRSARIPIMIFGLAVVAAIATYAVLTMSLFALGFTVGFGMSFFTMTLCAASGASDSYANTCLAEMQNV